MADCILTYSGVVFYPLELAHEDIRIEDIAHALLLMTRANGQLQCLCEGGEEYGRKR